jgi:hypothetical protein
VIRQLLVQGIAQIPAMGQMEARRLDELAFGVDPFEEHDELELEEDDQIDAGAASLGVELPRPVSYKREVEFGLEVAIEVIGRDERLQRDGNGLVEAAGLGRAEHGDSGAKVDAEGAPSPA